MSVEPRETLEVKIDENTTLVGDYFDNPSRTGIVLLPGFTEHRSSLHDTAKILSEDFKTWAFDINSQGESTGKWELEELQKSTYFLQKHLKERYGLTRMGGLGNSVGGMAIGMVATQEDSNLDCLCLTSVPAGLQDTIAPWQLKLLEAVPQPLVRAATIAFDKFESRRNENYRVKSHSQFKQDGRYLPHAQLGALKISNLKEFVQDISNAPRLEDYVRSIDQPILFVYGGNASLFGIEDDILPKTIKEIIRQTGSLEKDVRIIPGADHSLNTSTKIDDCFNQSPEYQYVKDIISNHFKKYLL